MKTSLLVLFTCLLSFQFVNAQDIITKRTGEDIQAKVFEITPTEIKYKRFDNIEGPTFTLFKSDVVMIRYENGSKEIFNETTRTPAAGVVPAATPAPALSAREMFQKGQDDAEYFYKGYKGAGTGTLITSLVSPLVGLIPAVATSSSTPKDRNLGYPSTDMMGNPDYRNGYTLRARKIKSKKVWTNWAIGLGANIFVLLITN